MLTEIIHEMSLAPPLQILLVILIATYTPFGIYQMYLVLSSIISDHRKYPAKERTANNNVIVAITTNGNATDVVEMIVSKIRGYGICSEIFVIKEERDNFRYSCSEIVVPKDFKCPNGSRNKMRALQYGNEWLHDRGYGKETYICHLDDDSLVDGDYLRYVKECMTEGGGQGCITLRAFGRHFFSSLSDIGRISNCESWCRRYNSKNRPRFVHGEGLVVRADVEYDIGWDYGTYGAEDLIMGLNISRRYRFEHIPEGNIFVAPPTTMRDYYKQRRRWFWSVLKDNGIIRHMAPSVYFLYAYMYICGILGIGCLTLFPILLFTGIYIGPYLTMLCLINLICFYGYYQFGAMHYGSLKVALCLFLFQIPVAFYDGFTILYSIVTRPDFTTFETIKKI